MGSRYSYTGITTNLSCYTFLLLLILFPKHFQSTLVSLTFESIFKMPSSLEMVFFTLEVYYAAVVKAPFVLRQSNFFFVFPECKQGLKLKCSPLPPMNADGIALLWERVRKLSAIYKPTPLYMPQTMPATTQCCK